MMLARDGYIEVPEGWVLVDGPTKEQFDTSSYDKITVPTQAGPWYNFERTELEDGRTGWLTRDWRPPTIK